MKKLITVTWKYSAEIEIPCNVSNLTADLLKDPRITDQIKNIAYNACYNAALNTDWKDGVITNVQDV